MWKLELGEIYVKLYTFTLTQFPLQNFWKEKLGDSEIYYKYEHHTDLVFLSTSPLRKKSPRDCKLMTSIDKDNII